MTLKHLLPQLFALCILCAASFPSYAQNHIQELQQSALDLKLDKAELWLRLGHYQKSGRHFESEVDDKLFFLNPNGKHDPKAELLSTIEQVFSTDQRTNFSQCRFPARFDYLQQALNVTNPVQHDCFEYQGWLHTINAHAISLIFPAAYINSPSSMFGHTFLRLDPDTKNKSPLRAFALNYSADSSVAANGLSYTWGGLTGGFPGQFNLVPYYEKIREYSALENRDIWEYQLKLNETQVHRLVAHAWELRDIDIDYYFLDENCSYQLLSLLEVARPDLDLLSPFGIVAIPVDTVRQVEQANLIGRRTYRPSKAVELTSHLRKLNSSQYKVAYQLAGDTPNWQALDAYTKLEQARILDSAIEYSRYQAHSHKNYSRTTATHSFALLRRRAALQNRSQWPKVKIPATPPELGHNSARLATGAGSAYGDNYISLQYRPSFHDLLDPVAGFSPGAQINFLNIDLRYYENAGLQLQDFSIIDIVSLNARDKYFKPISWRVNTGLRNIATADNAQYAAHLDSAGGIAYRIGDKSLIGLYGGGELDGGPELRYGFRAAPQIELIALGYLGDKSNIKTYARASHYWPENKPEYRIGWQQSLHLSRNISLRLEFEAHQLDRQWYNNGRLSAHWYF